MFETCKLCGTKFKFDQSTLTENILWFQCSVCKSKWKVNKNDKNIKNINKASSEVKELTNETEKVKSELASIKSVVQDKSKIMSKNNPILDVKNKSIAEISSELSVSKLNVNKKNSKETKVKINKRNTKRKSTRLVIILVTLIFFLAGLLFFRSQLLAYAYFYFPKYIEKYEEKIFEIFNLIELPIPSENNYINMTDFAATIKYDTIKFSGILKNHSLRPILAPRIRILAIGEDRKILMEKIFIINDKIIYPSSKIDFNDQVKINFKEDNITVKAIILKYIFEF